MLAVEVVDFKLEIHFLKKKKNKENGCRITETSLFGSCIGLTSSGVDAATQKVNIVNC